MTQLKVFKLVKKELSLSDKQYDRYAGDMKAILKYLEQKYVFFEEGNLLAFVSHIMTLFMRLETGEKVTGMGDEVLLQLNPYAIKITQNIMEMLQEPYGIADNTETALAAIHIHTALEIMKDSII